jgi:hypothetical protein
MLIIALIAISTAHSQNDEDTVLITSSVIRSFRTIASLIRAADKHSLSKLIDYPLARKNPLPKIENQNQFLSRFDLLFDRAFYDKFRQYDDSCIFYHNGYYGLVGGSFHGDIWISHEGKIIAINHESAMELSTRKHLEDSIKATMHESVRDWETNIFFGQTRKYLIRVDETSRGLRYSSWQAGQHMSDKPSLVLYDGEEEPQGSGGGSFYLFKISPWTYRIEDREMCTEEYPCGWFLTLLKGDTEVSSTELKEIQ